jgi:hypothetical protein
VIAGTAPRPLTQEEDNGLRTMATAGATSEAIAAQLQRSEKAIRARAARLRVILRRSKFIKRSPQGTR